MMNFIVFYVNIWLADRDCSQLTRVGCLLITEDRVKLKVRCTYELSQKLPSQSQSKPRGNRSKILEYIKQSLHSPTVSVKVVR